MSRHPNDDRSDVKNPNNSAYWHDLANRGGDDDDDGSGGHISNSWLWRPEVSPEEHARRERQRLESIDANYRVACEEREAARQRFEALDRPLALAEEAYNKAAERWRAAEDGEMFRREAEALWDLALDVRASPKAVRECTQHGVDFWGGVGSPAARAHAKRRVNKVAAALEAAQSGTARAQAAGQHGIEEAEAAVQAFEDRTAATDRGWDDEAVEEYERLRRVVSLAEAQRWADGFDAAADVDAAERVMKAARAEFVKEHFETAMKAARAAWTAAKADWAQASRRSARLQEEFVAYEAAKRRAHSLEREISGRLR